MANGTVPRTCLNYVLCDPVVWILTVIAICGILLNLSLIVVFLKEKRLQRPIYIGVPLLALPDLLFLTARLVFLVFREFFASSKSYKESYVIRQVVNCVLISSYFSSATHVVLLSLQQYLFIAYPLESSVSLRNTKVISVSVLTWVACIVIGTIYVYVVVISKAVYPKFSSTFNIVLTLIVIILPVVLLTLLHFLKKKVLQNAMIVRPNRTVRKMARVVSFVIGGYLITTTPINIKDIVEISLGFQNDTWFIILHEVSSILLFLNYTINPFIYFFSTPQFRHAFLCCRKGRTRKATFSSVMTSQTSFN